MRKAFSLLLTLTLFFSQTAWSAMPLCASVHMPTRHSIDRIRIVADSSVATSQLRLIKKEFSEDPSSLADLIAMASQTTAVRLDQKNFDKKSEITLGLLLSDGYSLEFHYEADARFGREKFVIQSVDLVSPSNYRKEVTKQVLDRNKLEFYADGIHDLKDLYPAGHHVSVSVPIFVEGSLLKDFRNILPRLGNFKKDELRQLTEKGNVKKLRFLSHFRVFKEFVQQTLTKMSFKESVRMGVLILAMSYFQQNPSLKETVRTEVPTVQSPTSQKWVREMNFQLKKSLAPEAEHESALLEQEIQSQLGNQTPPAGLDLNQPKIQVGLNDFIWLIERPETKRTFLAFSRDLENGNLEYFLIEINPATYPKTIEALKSSNLQMKLK